tara:strand:- start:21224 stop:21454 length:231 start_codon:yes stop_codon:yes gene_type:complete
VSIWEHPNGCIEGSGIPILLPLFCSRLSACGRLRIALYGPSLKACFTEPLPASRPIGDDRWRKGGPGGPLMMSGIL